MPTKDGQDHDLPLVVEPLEEDEEVGEGFWARRRRRKQERIREREEQEALEAEEEEEYREGGPNGSLEDEEAAAPKVPGPLKIAWRRYKVVKKTKRYKLFRNNIIAFSILVFGFLSIISQWFAVFKSYCCIFNGLFWMLIGFILLWFYFRKLRVLLREESGIDEEAEETTTE